MGTESELSRNWMPLHIGEREPAGTAARDAGLQDRPLGARALDGEGSRASRHSKGDGRLRNWKEALPPGVFSFPATTKL